MCKFEVAAGRGDGCWQAVRRLLPVLEGVGDNAPACYALSASAAARARRRGRWSARLPLSTGELTVPFGQGPRRNLRRNQAKTTRPRAPHASSSLPARCRGSISGHPCAWPRVEPVAPLRTLLSIKACRHQFLRVKGQSLTRKTPRRHRLPPDDRRSLEQKSYGGGRAQQRPWRGHGR